MAISAASMWEIRQDATASNANGGGFSTADPSTAFPTDLTATSATGNSPVVSSATYTFVAGDVGAWVYVKTGTNWTAGFYEITSVAAGAATLKAAVGEAVQYDSSQGRWKANTVAGCATTASPTGGTFAVDYSQQTAAEWNLTGVTTAAADAILLSASAAVNMVGNFCRIASGTNFTTGWYQIVSVSAGVSITLDRTCTTAAGSNGVVNIGGALSMNSTLDDDVMESCEAGNTWWIRNTGTAVSLGESLAISKAGTSSAQINIEGYNSIRGNRPTGSTRPTINISTANISIAAYWNAICCIFTGSASTVFNTSASKILYCKFTNTSTTAGRNAIATASDAICLSSEFISYRGRGLASSAASYIGCYFHDSDIGFLQPTGTNQCTLINCIFESCVTAALSGSTAQTGLCIINGCTFFGALNTTGIGINLITGVTDTMVVNCIISGFTTGIAHADAANPGFDDYNCYYNNDTDVSNWLKGANDVTTNPSFTNVGQVTGTTGAFTAGNDRLVDTSKNFTSLGVVANQDHVYIISGTGVTAGIYAITSITTTTNPNDTLVLTPAPGTNTTADKVYQITIGHNFLPTGDI